MKLIHKYPFKIAAGEQELTVTFGARVLLCECQRGVPTIWCLLDSKSFPKLQAKIRVLPTGGPYLDNDLPDGWGHVGSFQDGQFVWHVFSPDLEKA